MSDLAQLLALAKQDQNVLAVGTEGSLNNPAHQTDAWSDLDVTLFVADMAQANGQWWVEQFGTPTIVQVIEDQHLFGPATGRWQSWLTRYPGTKRIDLKLAPVADIDGYLAGDSLNTLVWRRDQAPLPASQPDARSHNLPVPTQAQLDECVNEFYWVAGYVVKALARKQLLAANEILNQHVRPELLRLLNWRQTIRQGGQFNPGAANKYLEATLSEGEQQQLLATYAQTSLVATKASLQAAVALFTQTHGVFTGYQATPYQASALAQLQQWLAQ